MDDVTRERMKLMYESDFSPFTEGPVEYRQTHAANYTAYQLGQISKKLDVLIAALNRDEKPKA